MSGVVRAWEFAPLLSATRHRPKDVRSRPGSQPCLCGLPPARTPRQAFPGCVLGTASPERLLEDPLSTSPGVTASKCW